MTDWVCPKCGHEASRWGRHTHPTLVQETRHLTRRTDGQYDLQVDQLYAIEGKKEEMENNTAHRILHELNTADDTPIPKGEPGERWGSAQYYRQTLVVQANEGKGWEPGGFVFSDGSAVTKSEGYASLGPNGGLVSPPWVALTAEQAALAESGVLPNEIGLTHYRADEGIGLLAGQLTRQEIEYTSRSLPTIVGMAGEAYLVHYQGPQTGQPTTVLVIPHQWEIDAVGEEGYYFVGLTEAEAYDRDWVTTYDQVQELRGGPLEIIEAAAGIRGKEKGKS